MEKKYTLELTRGDMLDLEEAVVYATVFREKRLADIEGMYRRQVRGAEEALRAEQEALEKLRGLLETVRTAMGQAG